MRRLVFYRVCSLLALALSFASVCQTANGAGAKPAVDLRLPPTTGQGPVDISVGLYITNFVAIDETSETFEVGGFLTGRWQDPRLALPGNQPGEPRTFRLEDIWAPAIEGRKFYFPQDQPVFAGSRQKWNRDLPRALRWGVLQQL
jgi:hypothetical protein